MISLSQNFFLGCISTEVIDLRKDLILILRLLNNFSKADIIQKFPMASSDIFTGKEIVKEDVVEFKTFGFVHCQAKHVCQKLRYLILHFLIPDNDHLIASKLGLVAC